MYEAMFMLLHVCACVQTQASIHACTQSRNIQMRLVTCTGKIRHAQKVKAGKIVRGGAQYACLQVLAAKALEQGTARGQAYFISDGVPTNNFEFLRPLADELKVPFPTLRIPTDLALAFATACEAGYRWLRIPPVMTRAVRGRTHHARLVTVRVAYICFVIAHEMPF